MASLNLGNIDSNNSLLSDSIKPLLKTTFIYSQVPLKCGPIKQNTAYIIVVTEAEYKSHIVYSPYLTLKGEVWAVFCEDFEEYWPRYNSIVIVSFTNSCGIILTAISHTHTLKIFITKFCFANQAFKLQPRLLLFHETMIKKIPCLTDNHARWIPLPAIQKA